MAIKPKPQLDLEQLVLFLAEKLKQQYIGRPDYADFLAHINEFRGIGEKEEGEVSEHEQGKLPPV